MAISTNGALLIIQPTRGFVLLLDIVVSGFEQALECHAHTKLVNLSVRLGVDALTICRTLCVILPDEATLLDHALLTLLWKRIAFYHGCS